MRILSPMRALSLCYFLQLPTTALAADPVIAMHDLARLAGRYCANHVDDYGSLFESRKIQEDALMAMRSIKVPPRCISFGTIGQGIAFAAVVRCAKIPTSCLTSGDMAAVERCAKGNPAE